MALFKLHAPFPPSGDQPQAIKALLDHRPGLSTLMGVTGSGKTFAMANVIAAQNKPVLILSPNKTLAAQLYEEFSLFFPENKVCYFVSYYDYYQPESYLPAQDIYIPKETKVNSEIERLRVEATTSLINRRDTIVIASVSCIYSLGNPKDYRELALPLRVGQKIEKNELLRQLVFLQYIRNDFERKPGTVQLFGSTLEINLPYQKDKLRITLFGDAIESISWVSPTNNAVLYNLEDTLIFPAKHFVMKEDKRNAALITIKAELDIWAPQITNIAVRERLINRVTHDLAMLKETGYCSGIENYSIHFDGRRTDHPPFCLLDFFGEDFLILVDESHITLPQFRGMYAGDRARKDNLIKFGFRLPSAYDNRPLKFDEVERYFRDVIFISATPGDYELSRSNVIAEQIIRPTGLIDPEITVLPRENQLPKLITEINETTKNGYRTLVTVLTKKLAEELARYLEDRGIKVCYLHSELKTPQRTELLHKLRLGIFDCLVGVNLLREGLDLPEVALVAIMDADVESYLRDKRSLIQTIGRAARNIHARVLMFADTITKSMKAAIEETSRRRALQQKYNEEHGITPTSARREVGKSISNIQQAIAEATKAKKVKTKIFEPHEVPEETRPIDLQLADLERMMQEAAEALDFDRAIQLREQWFALQKKKPTT